MDASRAFAPGTLTGGSSLAARVPNIPSMPGIPSLTTTATSGAQQSTDGSGWVVNYGGSASSGGLSGIPWGLIAAGALVVLLLRRKG
jgi:hypothetical protein